jgi:N-methylhydantoinase B
MTRPTDDATDGVDPITLTVLWNRLVGICEEMGTTLQRTGKSEAVSAGQDFSTALFDRHGRMIAQGNFSPGHLGSMPMVLQHVTDRFPTEELEPGDGILLNDSKMGSGHLPDFFLVTPVFVDDRLEGFTVTTAHMIDVGGLAPGSQAVDAEEIYQEGLRFFPTRIVRDDEIQRWFEDVIRANSRVPETVLGDVRAQQNANHRGRSLYRDLCEEYGVETVYTYLDEILDRSEARIRQSLESIPDGAYRFEDLLDDVGPGTDPVDLSVTITVDGSDMVIDYGGSDPATATGINSYLNYTRAYSLFVFKSVTEKHLHQNEGVTRPLTVEAPPGSFFNPELPTASGARPIISTRIVDLNLGALAQAKPEAVTAASSHWANPNFDGVDPDTGERYIVYDVIVGGVGAAAHKDGEEGLVSSFNMSNIPVEIHETRYPVRIERLELIEDSGGAGRHRGGLGLRKDVTLYGDDISVTNLMERTDSRPWGLQGGEPGDRAEAILNPEGGSEPLHGKGEYDLDSGDTVSFRVSGGGGFGEPLHRDPEAVLEDVRKGYVSPDGAREAYGVVIERVDGEYAVDEAATTALREERSD